MNPAENIALDNTGKNADRYPKLEGFYVRPGLRDETKGWLTKWVNKTRVTKLMWSYRFTMPGVVGTDTNAGDWILDMRIDITTPSKKLDGHGGCPHVQISSLIQQSKTTVTMKSGDKLEINRSFACKANEDSWMLPDDPNKAHNLIHQLLYPAGKSKALPDPILTWLAGRIAAQKGMSDFKGGNQAQATVDIKGWMLPVDGERRHNANVPLEEREARGVDNVDYTTPDE